MRISAEEVAVQYSRLGVRCLVALKSVAQVVLVVHVTLGAQVVVEAHLALPSHSHDAMFLAAVTDDVGVAHTWRGGRSGWRKVSGVINSTCLRFLLLLCLVAKSVWGICHVLYRKMLFYYTSPTCKVAVWPDLKHSRYMSCPYQCNLSQRLILWDGEKLRHKQHDKNAPTPLAPHLFSSSSFAPLIEGQAFEAEKMLL